MTLVAKFVPDFEIRHERQTVGLEGRDLKGKRCKQILASARNIPLDSIHQLSDTKFIITSQSYPGHQYLIDYSQSTCDCNDFLRIRFCKHIAAINVHFPELLLEPEESNSPVILERVCAQILPQSAPGSDADEKHAILLKEINALCQQLTAVSNDGTPDLDDLKSVKYSLSTAIALANGSRALPKKDDFNPNKKTWAETAKRMGARKAPKRKPGLASGNTMEKCIGAVKGKHRKYSDPYAAGERLGKRAKPDAVSTAANERARATVPAPPCAAALSPTHVTPSAAAAGSAEGSFTCANRSTAVPLAYPPSSVAPRLTLPPFPAALRGHVFVPPSAAIPGFAYAGTSAPTFFRAEITPRNAFAHPHFSPGHST